MEANILQAKDLRIGNVLHYTTAENDVLETTIDWQDLKWISEDPKGFNLAHYPIPLSEDWLLELGFESDDNDFFFFEIDEFRELHYVLQENKWGIYERTLEDVDNGDLGSFVSLNSKQYAHQLQNLYFALTNEELTIKE